eukprot:TRINITY_DN6483_c0_g1_i1.p1 TRINITY_DN6483_c0_g1~~TRINITY_DN6483_c0_g1_i1.p1  ORF type:complete len:212 (+),score=34.42 TRINITY_DN6483_c0_g1_i1:87-722(+)
MEACLLPQHFCRDCLDASMLYQPRCPLCRFDLQGFKPVSANVDTALLALMESSIPSSELAERRKEAQAEASVRVSKLRFRVLVGNEHKKLGRNLHEWKVYVRLQEDVSSSSIAIQELIKKVTFELHETFPDPIVVVRKPPYELEGEGWGAFEVKIKVDYHEHWGLPPTETTHWLDFDNDDNHAGFLLETDKPKESKSGRSVRPRTSRSRRS